MFPLFPYVNIIPKAKTTRPHTIVPSSTLPLAAPLLPGSSFATLAVALPVARKQLAVPQPYPLGQQPAVVATPAPDDEGHSVQPPAQVPSLLVVAAAAALAGTTTVTPSDTIVVDAVVGHDVTWQSRPVWQQPPPYTAEQA